MGRWESAKIRVPPPHNVILETMVFAGGGQRLRRMPRRHHPGLEPQRHDRLPFRQLRWQRLSKLNLRLNLRNREEGPVVVESLRMGHQVTTSLAWA
jgi:hypothetical protein